MKAQDFMSQDNNRADMVSQLQKFCDDRGFSYEFTQKWFKVKLPDVEPVPITNAGATAHRRHKTVDTSDWGPVGPVEGEEEQLPPIDKPLKEGETPDESGTV